MYHTLTHHGILGQKWGKRNGPPYPLDESNHSVAEKKAAKESSAKKADNGEKAERKGLTDGQKRAIKIGAAVVGTALLAYGGYTLYKSGKLNPVIDKFRKEGENSVKGTFDGAPNLQTAKERFGELKGHQTFEDNLAKVSVGNINHHDCGNGSVALLEAINSNTSMRAKDIDHGMKWTDMKALYPTAETKPLVLCETPGEINDYLVKHCNDGDNGLIGLVSASIKDNPNHFIAFSVKQNNVTLYDHQSEFKVSEDITLKGLKMDLGSGTVELGGMKFTGDKARTMIEKYIGTYNTMISEYMNVKGHDITDNTQILDQYFERR